jgi:stage II sporulation protein D
LSQEVDLRLSGRVFVKRRRIRGGALFAGFAVLAATFGSCRTAPTVRTVPTAPVRSEAPVAPVGDVAIAPPVIRVGILLGVPRVSVGADSGVIVRSTASDAAPLRLPRATFLPREAGTTLPPRYRVQLASLREEAAAREVVQRIESLKLPTDVRWSEETRTFQVRAGSWASREDASAQVGCFQPFGFVRPWVVEEPQPPASSGLVQLLEAGRDTGAVTLSPVRPEESLSVDGMTYRGVVMIRPDDAGGINVINVLNLEDYLRGVVPNELSPIVYAQIEAQKAQAIAARTYAVRNYGQYEAKGYDICATQACQVYRGRSTEHPLSDQAIEETRSVIAASEGQPINALYTSTCGGHTEDGVNIFEGQPEPYLKGVACHPERTLWATLHTSQAPRRLGQEEGLGRDVALLISLDVVEPSLYSAEALKAKATDEELRAWTTRLVTALARRGCTGSPRPVTRRSAFFRHAVDSMCWADRAKRLLGPQDSDYLLQLDDRATLTDADERQAAALLLQEGVLSPFEDNTLRPQKPITRAEAVHLLAGLAEKAGGPSLRSGLFKGYDGERLIFAEGESQGALGVKQNLWLFRALDGTPLGTSELSLTAGDKVSLVAKDDHVVFLEAQQSRLGAAADRTSRYFRWEVRLTPDEVARSIERYGTVGRVLDIIPRRSGVSGRVVELLVQGTEGELLLKGLKVRWALNLRENLFVIDRERGTKGAVTRFIFTGKGWGHGVGLCQVGAWGMAQAGATYEEILQHYYTGVTLRKMSSGALARR